MKLVTELQTMKAQYQEIEAVQKLNLDKEFQKILLA
jgi:hypothetical protein